MLTQQKASAKLSLLLSAQGFKFPLSLDCNFFFCSHQVASIFRQPDCNNKIHEHKYSPVRENNIRKEWNRTRMTLFVELLIDESQTAVDTSICQTNENIDFYVLAALHLNGSSISVGFNFQFALILIVLDLKVITLIISKRRLSPFLRKSTCNHNILNKYQQIK